MKLAPGYVWITALILCTCRKEPDQYSKRGYEPDRTISDGPTEGTDGAGKMYIGLVL